jgi:uroporphyrinogen decarboxylase
MYGSMDGEIIEKIVGSGTRLPTINGMNSWGFLGRPGERSTVTPVVTGTPELVDKLHVDAIGIQVVPPIFADATCQNGRAILEEGIITSREALDKIIMPDPDDEHILREIEKVVDQCLGDHALYARIRLGAAPTLLSMGITGFSYSLYDEPELVFDVLEMYCTWSSRFAKNLSEMAFDFFWCFDDIAFKSAPLFSEQVLREFFMPNMQIACAGIGKPWVFHSDGNLLPILDVLLQLGMNGLHPLEPGAMDLDELKTKYGHRLCLVGNIDIDKTLTKGTKQDVDNEVKCRIEKLGKNGGYIVSDSNSVPSFCNHDNIIEMSKAVERYRYIY